MALHTIPFLVVSRPKFPSPNSGPMTPSRLVAVPLDHDHRVDATWPFRSDMNGRKVTNLPFKDPPFCDLELLWKYVFLRPWDKNPTKTLILWLKQFWERWKDLLDSVWSFLLGVRGFMERKHRGVGADDILFSWGPDADFMLRIRVQAKNPNNQCVYVYILYICLHEWHMYPYDLRGRPILGSGRTWQGPALKEKHESNFALASPPKNGVEWLNLNFLFGFIEKQSTWKRHFNKRRQTMVHHQWEEPSLRWSWKTHAADQHLHADCELAAFFFVFSFFRMMCYGDPDVVGWCGSTVVWNNRIQQMDDWNT